VNKKDRGFADTLNYSSVLSLVLLWISTESANRLTLTGSTLVLGNVEVSRKPTRSLKEQPRLFYRGVKILRKLTHRTIISIDSSGSSFGRAWSSPSSILLTPVCKQMAMN